MAASLLTPTLASTMTWSSTSEGYGSFHSSHLSSVLPHGFRPRVSFGVCVVFVCFLFVLFWAFFLNETMGSRGFTLLVHPTEMVPHDRQGFTARSATRKKNSGVHFLDIGTSKSVPRPSVS